MREKAVIFALDLLYIPYIWGGQSKDGFDCSGFCNYIAWEFDLLSKHKDYWTQKWYEHLKSKKVVDIKRGCYLFYGKDNKHIVHMMMAINDKACIGATRGNKWMDTPEKAARRHARIDIRPIKYRRDLIAICDPWE